MNCEEVQEQLSEYLETLLDSSAVRTIDIHLAACARCTEMLADLAQCQRLVAALPQVEPPVGFVTRVMAQVNESASQSPWWERWLLPLRLNVPLQATAVVLVGVLSVYLLQKEPSQKQVLQSTAPFSSGDSADGPPKRDIHNEPRSSEDATVARPQLQQAKKSNALGPTFSLIETPAKAGLSGAKAQAERAALPPAPAVTSELPPQPVKPIIGTFGVSQRSGSLSVSMPPTEDRLFPERRLFGERMPLSAVSLLPEIELIVRRHAPSQQESSAESALRSQGDTELVKESDGKTGAVRSAAGVSWQIIPASRYEQFKKELAAQGVIESETQLPAREREALLHSDQLIRVKVITLPPLPNDSAR
jgi:hypothetical protein